MLLALSLALLSIVSRSIGLEAGHGAARNWKATALSNMLMIWSHVPAINHDLQKNYSPHEKLAIKYDQGR